MHNHFFFLRKYATGRIFSFQMCLQDIFFLNHLTSPSKDKQMPKAPREKKGFEDFFILA